MSIGQLCLVLCKPSSRHYLVYLLGKSLEFCCYLSSSYNLDMTHLLGITLAKISSHSVLCPIQLLGVYCLLPTGSQSPFPEAIDPLRRHSAHPPRQPSSLLKPFLHFSPLCARCTHCCTEILGRREHADTTWFWFVLLIYLCVCARARAVTGQGRGRKMELIS